MCLVFVWCLYRPGEGVVPLGLKYKWVYKSPWRELGNVCRMPWVLGHHQFISQGAGFPDLCLLERDIGTGPLILVIFCVCLAPVLGRQWSLL